MGHKVRLLSLVLAVAGASASIAADLEVIDTTKRDQLEDANHASGGSDVAVGPGEAVSSFNGNLQVTHASSPVLPHDGGLSISLARTYNSNGVRKYRMRYSDTEYREFVSGRGPFGLGWMSHVGRIIKRSRYTPENGSTPWNYTNHEKYFEFPDGALYRFEPTVKNAHPNLRIKFFVKCIGGQPENSDPPPPAWCQRYGDAPICNPENVCAGRPANDPAHYDVTFPGGTVYRMEEIVQPDLLGNWIKNHHRAGYYPTLITDVHGNKVGIEYWGSGNYPEAIKRIWAVRPQGQPTTEIATEVCTVVSLQDGCPELGLVREVKATGFKGQRSVAQQTIYTFRYQTVQVTDSGGAQNMPVLSEVVLTGSDGSSGGTTLYEYGVGQSLGQTVTTYGPLLDRITYPLGALSEFQYGTWNSGSRIVPQGQGWTTGPRQIVGVTRKTTYTEGLSTSEPHFSWTWTRSFGSTNCSTGGTDINSYEQIGPDSRRATYTVFGDPCGTTSQTVPNFGPFGSRQSTVILDGNPGAPLRTQTLLYNTPTDVDGEIVKVLHQTAETTFHDEKTGDPFSGGCFESASSTSKTISTTFFNRDSMGRWKTVVQGGSSYTKGGTSRVTHTNYLLPTNTPTGCQPTNAWDAKNIVGPFSSRYVEEGTQRFEENFQFDCNGQLTQTTVNPVWYGASTVPATGVPTLPNAANGSTDPRTVLSYNAAGNAASISALGGGPYPNGTAANTYSSTFQWELGIAKSTQVQNLTYLSTNVTPDPGGQIAASSDANSLETRFDFDGLGRPLEIDPPGTHEQKARFVYPDLKHVRTIKSPGTETTFNPASNEQLFEEQVTDNVGRVIQTWRSMPGASRGTQIIRYDQVGRVIFISEWMDEAEYVSAITWSSGDNNGDGITDYFVDGIPQVSPGVPWGTTVFYGTPDPNAPGNPLRATPEGLGRVRRVVATDGSVTRRDYCGPHEQIAVDDIVTDLNGAIGSSVTRNYFDALGRLVLVDAPNGSANAEYSYDARGNLTNVKLFATHLENMYDRWRAGQLPAGQVRTFIYDAAGRLTQATDPESGTRVVNGYDAGGNPLTWQDQMALNRGYHFRATYDVAGRPTKIERVRGAPTTTGNPGDLPRLAGTGDFEQVTDLGTGTGQWREGTISGTTFSTQGQSGNTKWGQVPYGGCLPAAPPGGGNTGALYMGNPANCTYSSNPAGRQAVRVVLTGVERDDVVSFKYWREVRKTNTHPPQTSVDRLQVFATLDTSGDNVSGARYLFELDSAQTSYATWRQTPDMRPGDLFSQTEWPEPTPGTPSTKNVYLYIAFEKGDTASTGSARGILIDDVFVGRRGDELVAEYSYDSDECTSGSAVADACSGEEPTSLDNGALTKAISYQSGRKLMEERPIYKGLNGRLSGRDLRIDWAGVGQLVTFVDRYWYTDQGQQSARYAPFQPGIETERIYASTYRRGYPDGLSTDTNDFIVPGTSSLGYSPAGVLQTIQFANGTSEELTLDKMYRPKRIQVTGPGGTPSLWDSSWYAFDGAGNISAIGGQSFAYDRAGRLTGAQVLPQATTPGQTAPFQVLYTYDALGNMEGRDWTEPVGLPQAPPAGMEFSSYDYGGQNLATSKNQLVNSTNYRYDSNGNTTRMLAADTPSSATWSPVGVMTAFYNGQPEVGSHRVAERYAYDSSRARVLRSVEGSTGDGLVVITIRDAAGTPLSEFVVDPLMGPTLERDYLWGVGRLLVEREAEPFLPLPGGGEQGTQGGGGATAEGGVDPCQIDPDLPGCGGGGGGEGDPPTSQFTDYYHHRDHLGSLRVVTNDAGAAVAKHDFYPFGMEMASTFPPMPGDSRMRYTVHERDAATGADYMMARYKLASGAGFLSADPIDDVSESVPNSWSKYGYVRGDPLNSVDPTGLACIDMPIWKCWRAEDGVTVHCEVSGYERFCGGGDPDDWLDREDPGGRGGDGGSTASDQERTTECVDTIEDVDTLEAGINPARLILALRAGWAAFSVRATLGVGVAATAGGKLVEQASRLGSTPTRLVQTAQTMGTRYIDTAHATINVFVPRSQFVSGASGYLRVTFNPTMTRVVSSGQAGENWVANKIACGRFVPLP